MAIEVGSSRWGRRRSASAFERVDLSDLVGKRVFGGVLVRRGGFRQTGQCDLRTRGLRKGGAEVWGTFAVTG
jgi:hypothetical protein